MEHNRKWNKFVLQERKLIEQWDKHPGKLIHAEHEEHAPAKLDNATGRLYFLRPVGGYVPKWRQ
jgi:hypothetical protein